MSDYIRVAALAACWVLAVILLARIRLGKRRLTALGGFALGMVVAGTLDLPNHLTGLTDAGRKLADLGIIAFVIALFIVYELICRAREGSEKS